MVFHDDVKFIFDISIDKYGKAIKSSSYDFDLKKYIIILFIYLLFLQINTNIQKNIKLYDRTVHLLHIYATYIIPFNKKFSSHIRMYINIEESRIEKKLYKISYLQDI
jgi:hypothetical protein